MGAQDDVLLTRDITRLSFAMFVLFGLGSTFLLESALQTVLYPAFLAINRVLGRLIDDDLRESMTDLRDQWDRFEERWG